MTHLFHKSFASPRTHVHTHSQNPQERSTSKKLLKHKFFKKALDPISFKNKLYEKLPESYNQAINFKIDRQTPELDHVVEVWVTGVKWF